MRDGVGDDILFLALTRPALWRGVPWEAVLLNVVASMVFFILIGNPLYALAGVPIHWVLRALAARDYNRFHVLRLWWLTKGGARNQDLWGGSSVSPLPLGRPRSLGEVRVRV